MNKDKQNQDTLSPEYDDMHARSSLPCGTNLCRFVVIEEKYLPVIGCKLGTHNIPAKSCMTKLEKIRRVVALEKGRRNSNK